MLFILYNLIQLFVILFFFLRFIWSWIFQKKSLSRLSAYLGFSLPGVKKKTGLSFLIYAVSMGETRAAASLFKKMKELYPEASFHIASRTETGHGEAKRSLKGADSHFFMPLDFSWNIRRLLRRLEPDVVLIIESDLWYSLLREAKRFGSLVFLVSGRVSLRSYKRFRQCSWLSKELFGLFDLVCAQNSIFQSRFISLGADPSCVFVTGNIKLDAKKILLSLEEKAKIRNSLRIQKADFVIVIGSTHAPEEVEIIKMLTPLLSVFPNLRLLIAPRHPERFCKVEEILQKVAFPFAKYSHREEIVGNERIILVDVMGKLSSMYAIADVAITCGSFDEMLSGHNILEPIFSGVPVLFGPYMKDQQDLVSLVLSFKAGVQLEIKDLAREIERLLKKSEDLKVLKENGSKLLTEVEGSSQKTIDLMEFYIKKRCVCS